jgi:Rrf2 family transcriptional regulator, nitric oxide-sensitive transcriptional repressor
MRLTRYTDYSLRMLMYVATHEGEVATIAQIAAAYGISRDHLMKVAQELGQAGYLRTLRGRAGGLVLARPPAEINIGAVVRRMEGDFDLVDCGSCVIAPICVLTGTLDRALAAFLAVLDATTLADLIAPKSALTRLFQPVPSPTSTLRT